MAEFDAYAENYADSLAQGLAISGEDGSFYLRGRVAWVKRCLDQIGIRPTRCLDFGCGCGDSAAELTRTLGVQMVTGVDVSISEIELARRKYPTSNPRFWELSELNPSGGFDFAYTNGVFHHIPPGDRRQSLQYVRDSLEPGGYFAFWENNPWNPGTSYVMSRIPFDRDAITLTPRHACRLLESAGFRVIHITFLFVFPRVFSLFRPLEPFLARFPLGAQYQVLCLRT